ncbi:MAG: MBOAT family protein [Clostridia bacterium]|nr:MBOAT family protein [Clostridia bacterium]
MSFFTLQFAALLAAALIFYYALPKKCGWVVLLAVSLAFYAWGGVKTIFYLLFTAGTTYASGLILGRFNRRDADEGKVRAARKKLTVAACVLLNFSVLFAVKYWDQAAGLFSLPRLSLVLPLGLSFYTFASIGYVIDCYRGKQSPEKNPLKYLLFVSFFPTVVQGPISRFGQLAPQFTAAERSADNVKRGLQTAMWGCLKKLIVANRAAVVADAVFANPENYGGAFYAIGVLFYCIQLYCDFSGGIDVARGVALTFGIDLTENFKRPIFAVSLADYWRRWHITLGTWMRDYVFYPLSFSRPMGAISRFARKHVKGKAGKVIPTAAATFVVYLLIGIWHGSSLKYIFFGLYNGAIMTASVLLAGVYSSTRNKLKINEKGAPLHFFRLVRTMAIVFVGRYFTRAPRLLAAFAMLGRTFTHPCLYQLTDGTALTFGLTAFDFAVIAAGVAVILAVEFFEERGAKILDALDRKGALVQFVFILIPLAIITAQAAFGGDAIDASSIYRQF